MPTEKEPKAPKAKKTFQVPVKTLMRSEVKLADYNPRGITDEARKALKKNIKERGLMGGLVFNEQTGNIVGGHQRIGVIDEMMGYDPTRPETDYPLRFDVVSLTEKEEKEQNLFLNSKHVQGTFNHDMIRQMGAIDYEAAGLSSFDQSMILPPDNSQFMTADFSDMFIKKTPDNTKTDAPTDEEQQAKIQGVKDAKQAAKDRIAQRASDNLLSYLTLNFPNYAAKEEFMNRFGFDPSQTFIDGPAFADRCEVIYEDPDPEEE